MAYVKLADGSTFNGTDEVVAKAIAEYTAKVGQAGKTAEDIWSNITISPKVTKIVEKVPVEVEKVVEKMVQVPVLPERPLTKDEISLIRDMQNAARKSNRDSTIIGLVVAGVVIFGFAGLCIWLNKK